MKLKFSDIKQRERWFSAMQIDLMSSEDSEIEAEEPIITVKKLPWRSNQIDELMKRLDEKIKSTRSPQAIRQAKKRLDGNPSTRPRPSINENLPAWLFK